MNFDKCSECKKEFKQFKNALIKVEPLSVEAYNRILSEVSKAYERRHDKIKSFEMK